MSYIWNGHAHKGAMKVRREIKRAQAEQRNANAHPLRTCDLGHRHGANASCPAAS